MKTQTRTMLALATVLLLVGVAGCLGGGQAADQSDSTDTTTNGTIVYDEVQSSEDVVRFVDEEAGVVCYYFAKPDGYAGQGGLSCVPMNETNLGQ